jgi:multidrug efflux pump subunit AcrA (membrane-fusion protein)
MEPSMNNPISLTLTGAAMILLAACSAQPPGPTTTYVGPAPGTVTVHLNGSVETSFGISSVH